MSTPKTYLDLNHHFIIITQHYFMCYNHFEGDDCMNNKYSKKLNKLLFKDTLTVRLYYQLYKVVVFQKAPYIIG